MKSALVDYIDSIHRHPENYPDKVRKCYLKIIEPVVKGESKDYYFDPKYGQSFVRFCQGDLQNQEQLSGYLKSAHGLDNYEKVDWIEKNLHVNCGLIRESSSAWRGLPLILMPYQMAYEEAMEGIRRRDNHKRRFRRGLMIIPKKNGKTEWKAAKAIFKLVTVPGIQILCTATQYDQAKVLFDSALAMKNNHPVLRAFLGERGMPKPEINVKRIPGSKKQNLASFNVLPKASQGQDGKRPDYAIIDECHACPMESYNLIYDGMASSPDPELELISTQGIIHPCLLDTVYDEAKKAVEGIGLSDDLFPLVYELDPEDDWRNPQVWAKSNPGLGITKSREFIQGQVNNAIDHPEKVPDLLTKQFDVPGVDAENVWLTADQINQPINFTKEEFAERFEKESTTSWGGFDLSSTGDMTCAGRLYADREKNILVWDCDFWVTKKFLDSDIAKSTTVPWQAWIRTGLVHVSKDPYSIIDTDVAQYFYDKAMNHNAYFYKIGYDPWHAEGVLRMLENWFSRTMVLTPVRQNFNPTLDGAIKYMGTLLSSHRLTYNDNPVMKWCLSNTAVIEDKGGNLKLNKAAGQKKNKIDGTAALVDALATFWPERDKFLTGEEETSSGGENE